MSTPVLERSFPSITRSPKITKTALSKTVCRRARTKWERAILSKDRGHPYSLRYIGSLVADFHRNLLKGGIFLYPGPKGKLRLLYEASPLAMIVEQAGGAASTGEQRILDIQPTSLHERVPLIIGS